MKFSTLILLLVSALSFSNCNKSKCKEKEGANCICTKQYDPVCGCNDKTYGNSCEAECAGITEYSKGTCQ